MRALVFACWFVAVTSAFAAPIKDPPPPAKAVLDFFGSPKAWEMTLEMTTASGAVYELRIDLDDNVGNIFRHMTQRQFIKANWMAEMSGDRSIHIYGVRTKEGKADAVKTLVLTNRVRRGEGQTPELRESGGVKVKTRKGEAGDMPAREGKPPPPGPDLGEEPFVEFDFSPLPEWSPDVKFSLRVDTADPKTYFKTSFTGVGSRADICIGLEESLNEIGLKAEVAGKTKLRVYGKVRDNRFNPATKGTVDSDILTPAELPKVTNPKRL
jgi:hypothetical protein